MSKIKKKNRKKIYKKVLKILTGDLSYLPPSKLLPCSRSEYANNSGLCEMIYQVYITKKLSSNVSAVHFSDSKRITEKFKELSLFEPEKCEDGLFWWERGDRESRKNALAIMIAMIS